MGEKACAHVTCLSLVVHHPLRLPFVQSHPLRLFLKTDVHLKFFISSQWALTMSFNQEPDDQEAGPSGISREETLALLGLDRSNPEQEEEENLLCPEVMEDSEDDDDTMCNDVMDRFERQRAFQTQLLQQSGGGGLDPQTPMGTFEFDLEPFVDRRSSRMGVRERHFNTRLRQTGNFLDSPHVVQALQDGSEERRVGKECRSRWSPYH